MSWLGWSLLSAAFAGLTAILAKIGVEHVDANLATAVRTSVIVLAAWLVAAATSRQPLPAVAPRASIYLTLSGLATAASWLCYFRARSSATRRRVAPIDKLSVVVTMVLAVVVPGETPSGLHWLGGALIVAGAVLLAAA